MKELDHELGKYDCCGILRKNFAVCAHETAVIAISLQEFSAIYSLRSVLMRGLTVSHLPQDAHGR
jgi:hypothetical protein